MKCPLALARGVRTRRCSQSSSLVEPVTSTVVLGDPGLHHLRTALDHWRKNEFELATCPLGVWDSIPNKGKWDSRANMGAWNEDRVQERTQGA